MPIGRLTRVNLKELWKHEEQDFSGWLEENMDLLSEVLGVSLTVVERERPVGDFRVDILAEDEAGNRSLRTNWDRPITTIWVRS